MSCKEECFKNPKHPDNKCCFNCGRDSSLCDSLHVCGSDCCNWKPKDDERRILIDIPADGNYIEILGHRIDGFESFEAFLEHLKKYAELEKTVKAQNAEIERVRTDFGNMAQHALILIGKARNEAVEEFAERLKEHLDDFYCTEEDGLLDTAELIDNLVKEMVGDEK